MLLKSLFNQFYRLQKLIQNKKFTEAQNLILNNPKLSKQPFFMHLCAHSKNYGLIKLALKYKPTFHCADEDYTPLHFLAHLGRFDYQTEFGHGLDFITVPYEYNSHGKFRKFYKSQYEYFDPKCIALLDKNKKYIYQIKGVNALAPIDICMNQLNIMGFKSFLDYGLNLKKLLSLKKKSSSFRFGKYNIGNQYFFASLLEQLQEVSVPNEDKINSLYNLIKKKLGFEINFEIIDKYLKANDYEIKTKNELIKRFKKIIR